MTQSSGVDNNSTKLERLYRVVLIKICDSDWRILLAIWEKKNNRLRFFKSKVLPRAGNNNGCFSASLGKRIRERE